MRTAVFTDNDFDKVNGVTTTWRAVLREAPAGEVRIYTAGDARVDLPDYFATESVGCQLPWYREMRVYMPRLRRFSRQLRRDAVDVIHVATPGPIGLAGRWLAARCGLPLVGSYHTHLGDYVEALSGSAALGRGVDAYMRWFYAPCRAILAPSQATMSRLAEQRYRTDRLRVWPRGVDTDLFTPERASTSLRRAWHADRRRPVILYAGRLSAEKGLSVIIAVHRHLHRQAIAHQLVFAGDGPMRPVLERECPDAVFLGTLPHREIATVMASSDLFLFPSGTDTFGNVVLEAQASGLPVLVSDRGGPRQQMRHRDTGYVCRTDDAQAFAEAAAALLRDPAKRESMGRAARLLATSRTWALAVRPLLTAWDEARRTHVLPRASSPMAQTSAHVER